MVPLLVNLTGFVALALNVMGLVRQSDRTLRQSTGWASAIWAANNLLIGAQSAAALSMLSVGRQASAEAVQGRGERLRLWCCTVFLIVTAVIGAVTWQGPITLFTTAGS
ncbi:MAG: YgjV family protein, partial [Burkholderiales bacterium]|nr:YgjV family protein [Burkholderiales bacterium]